MLHPGDLLDKKYRILSEVGRGGMSVVYLAINERANKTWAVKEIRKDGIMNYRVLRQSLLAETDMMKRLKHPNLPSIVDVIDSGDTFLIVMDYIEGISLLQLVRTEGAQPEEQVLKWGKQLCDVLGYLHRQDPPIIYRDMKPDNVILKPDGNIALVDFGTARELRDPQRTEDTVYLGTKGYAAPEQFGGRGQTDARTDIYCLGVTLYHLLTGHSPSEPPYEIKPLRYWIPVYENSGLEKLLLKCTEQDPSKRYSCCEELMYALDHYREEDERTQRKYKRQIAAFAAACMVSITAFAGTLFFKNAWETAVRSSYENLLSRAMYQETLEEAEGFFLQALEADAGSAKAYEDLMEKAETEIMREDRLTPQTARILNECLTRISHGNRTNQDVLKDEDPKQYAELMYEIGLWYFFLKGNSDEDRQTASANYFSKITEERYLDTLSPGKQEMTAILIKIGNYAGILRTKMGKVIAGGDSTYSVLYADLFGMISGNLKEKVEREYYCMAIYQQVAFWIDQKCESFLEDGVTGEDLDSLLDLVGQGLASLQITEENDNYPEYLEAVEALESAERTVRTYVSGRV